MEVLDYIAKRKEEILEILKVDRKIGADPYDDVARFKELEKVEKIIRKNLAKGEKCGTNLQKKS